MDKDYTYNHTKQTNKQPKKQTTKQTNKQTNKQKQTNNVELNEYKIYFTHNLFNILMS